MIYFVCNQCHVALRTVGDEGEISSLLCHGEWYPDNYPCPTNGCGHRMQMVENIESKALEILEIHSLTPIECYQAFYGLGYPPETQCDAGEVLKAFSGRTVVGANVQDKKGTKRCVLRWLLLDNGVRLYFGSGPDGAMIYRIAQPRSLVAEVLRERD